MVAVAHHDATINEIVVDDIGIVHTSQEEIGIGREDLLTDGQLGKGCHETGALGAYSREPLADLGEVLYHAYGLLLGELVHVVRILHLVEKRDNLGRGKGHAQADSGTSPCLAEGIEHNEVGPTIKIYAEGTLGGKVAIGFVHHHNTGEGIKNLLYLLAAEVVACGIVGRTKPDDLGVGIDGRENLVGIETVAFLQEDVAVLDIIDVGTHAIHSVCGFDGHHIVGGWRTEHTIDEVDGFVTAIAQEDMIGRHTLDVGKEFLELLLQGVGITIVGIVVGTLIGIEEDPSRTTLELIARTTVGLEALDVGTYDIL